MRGKPTCIELIINDFFHFQKNSMLLILSFSILLASCTKDSDLFEEVISANQQNEEAMDTGNESDSQNDGQANEVPCEFNLEGLDSDTTVTINCQIDLKGKTIDLPSNSLLEYNGGKIYNGTLNFVGENSTIDGRLLNSDLEVTGNVSLQNENFYFDPKQWDNIVQGKISDDMALENTININSIITLVNSIGARTFTIDEFDAFFDVRSYRINAEHQIEQSISLPSDFNLNMSSKTNLRVQPNNAPAYALIGVFKGSNINISGGNIYGDRFEHDYSPINDTSGNSRNSHEWGFVLQIAGGKNITIDNVNIFDASGDGFYVRGSSIRNEDGSPGGSVISEDILMKNCIIKRSRRNGISLIDGNGIIIENSEILDTGLGENPPGVEFSAAGTLPKAGVDLEAYRERVDGVLREYNRIENVIFRGNRFSNNQRGDIDLYTCNDVLIENNTFDGAIGNTASFNITIRNNSFVARIQEDGTPFPRAINIRSYKVGDMELNYNYEIYGNIIDGYTNAINLSGEDFTVYDNTLTNFKNGIGLGTINKGEFYNNNLISNWSNSLGYHSREADLFSVIVNDEYVETERHPFRIIKSQGISDTQLKFYSCEFISSGIKDNLVENSENILIESCTLNTDVEIVNSKDIVLKNTVVNKR